jgi:hypothetical protein
MELAPVTSLDVVIMLVLFAVGQIIGSLLAAWIASR